MQSIKTFVSDADAATPVAVHPPEPKLNKQNKVVSSFLTCLLNSINSAKLFKSVSPLTRSLQGSAQCLEHTTQSNT